MIIFGCAFSPREGGFDFVPLAISEGVRRGIKMLYTHSYFYASCQVNNRQSNGWKRPHSLTNEQIRLAHLLSFKIKLRLG